MISLFLLLLKPALRAAEGGSKNPLDWLALLIAFPLDILIAHTIWAVIFGWPKPYEITISHTLERLCRQKEHPDYELLVQIAKKINRISPTKDHIKAVP